MQTVHPSIMLGSYVWDEERLPRDEFDIRTRYIDDAISANGWAGVIVFGDAPEHASLAWFTNFIPRMRWAMGLFSAGGDRRILASMSSRDIPAMRTMTMIENVKSGWEWKWFDEWVAALGGEGRIGVIGMDQITPLLMGAMEKSFGAKYQLVPADDIATKARTRHRPREIAVIREAAGIARAAKAAFEEAWANGEDVENAALAAERTARDMAAHDIRTLVSRDGGRTLQPYQARFGDRPEHLVGYIAVKYLGYWADTFVQAGAPVHVASAANAAMKTLLQNLQSGAELSAVAKQADNALGSLTPHPALSNNFGARIGLSLRECDTIDTAANGVAQPGTAYSLHAGALDEASGGAVASALVVTMPGGALDILLTSGMDGSDASAG